MANEVLTKSGTAVTWTSSSGTYAMTMTSLATNTARVGPKHDRGVTRSRRIRVELEVKFASAPTDGRTVDVYLITSDDDSAWDGNTTPSDADLTSRDTLRNLVYVGSLVCNNVTTTQKQSWELEIGARYIAPVVDNNNTGQSFTSTGTEQKVTIKPIIDEIQ